MIRKYNNHTSPTNPLTREEEPQNNLRDLVCKYEHISIFLFSF